MPAGALLATLLSALAALGLLAGCGDEPPPAPARVPPLVDALRGGGLVLAIRHTATEATTDRQESLRSCGAQRNLTEAGRRQARELGEGLRALRVPIGDVRASPFCRTQETARLAFGRVRVDDDLTSLGARGGVEDDDRRVRALRRLLGVRRHTGGNRVLVVHTANLGEAAGISLVEGETAVYRPLGRARFVLVGRVRAEGWARLRPAA